MNTNEVRTALEELGLYDLHQVAAALAGRPEAQRDDAEVQRLYARLRQRWARDSTTLPRPLIDARGALWSGEQVREIVERTQLVERRGPKPKTAPGGTE